MSLELAIQHNTAAIERLIAVLTETVAQPVTVNIGEFPPPSQDAENDAPIAASPAEIEQPDPPKKTRAKKEPKPEAPAGEPDAATAEAPATPEATAPALPPPTYSDAADAVTAVIKAKGTPKAKEILARVGAKTLKDVSPEDFPAVICACELELA